MQTNSTLLDGVYFMYTIIRCPTCNALKRVLSGRRVGLTVCKLDLQNYLLHLIQIWCEMHKLKLSDEFKSGLDWSTESLAEYNDTNAFIFC
jgi:hypothetical protein